MFKFTLIDEYREIQETFDTANDVANFTFETTGLWMLAIHVKEVCNEAKSGDKWENEDVGLTIECI